MTKPKQKGLAPYRGRALDFLLYSERLQHGQTNSTGLPPEFRRKILELVRSGRSLNATPEEFDVWRQTAMKWMKQEDADSV